MTETQLAPEGSDGPEVTVIISVHDAEAYLSSAIDQIDAQTFDSFEVLVVDDASRDSTAASVAAWSARNRRVRVLTNETRLGVAASRNRALNHAIGSYVWFADCDDKWSPEILSLLVEEARDKKADVVICGARRLRADGHDAGPIAGSGGAPIGGPGDAVGRLLRGQLEGHLWNKLFKRELFHDVRFPPSYAFSDLGAMGPLLAGANTFALLDRTLYTYILRPGSILNSRGAGPRDLLLCREQMWKAVQSLPNASEYADDQLRFEYAAVYLPTLHGQIRRRDRDPESLAVRREIRASMAFPELVRLSRTGQAKLAAAAILLKYAYRPYALAYQAFRRVKWGSVSYGA